MSDEIEYRPGQFAKKGEWRTVNRRNYRFDGKWWEPMATGHHVIGAYAEGCESVPCGCSSPTVYGCTDCQGSGVHEPAWLHFSALWDELYGTWEENPFVWVYEFRRIER